MKLVAFVCGLLIAAYFCLGMVDVNVYNAELNIVGVKHGDTLDKIASRFYDLDERKNILGQKTIIFDEFRTEVWAINPGNKVIYPGDNVRVITYKRRM